MPTINPEIDEAVVLLGERIRDQQLLSRLIIGRNGSGVIASEVRPRLQRIVVGTNGMGFETSGQTYFSNHFSAYDKSVVDYYNFVDTSTGEQITNVYPTSAYFLQSSIFMNPASQSDDFLDEYLPNSSEGLKHIAQVGETVIGITPLTNNYKQTRMVQNPDTLFPTLPISSMNFEWYKDFEPLVPYVAIYPPSSIIMSMYPDTEAFDPIYLLSGISYNYMVDVDLENSRKKINRYDGILYSMQGPMKNFYNSLWDISARVYQGTSGIIETISATLLEDTRYYRNVNVNNTTIWQTFTFGNNYKLEEEVPEYTPNSPSLTATTRTSFTTATPIPMVLDSTGPRNDAHAYEHLERVKGFFVLGQENLHKSNLFSIRINNSNLNSRIDNTELRSQVQNSINSSIKQMVKRLSICSTQLFKIYWTGY